MGARDPRGRAGSLLRISDARALQGGAGVSLGRNTVVSLASEAGRGVLEQLLSPESQLIVNAGVVPIRVDGRYGRRSPLEDTFEIRVRLPTVNALCAFGNESLYVTPVEVVDLLARKLNDAGASMRGHAIQDLLLCGKPVNYEPSPLPSRNDLHEFYERLGSKMIEEGERLMCRAKATR